MSRIAEEMASLHRVAQEHAVNEELVLKIIKGLKEQVVKGRVASNVPGDVDDSPAVPVYHPGYKLKHPSVSQSLPVCKVMPAPAGRSSYIIGLVLDSNGDAVCISYSGVANGNLSMTDYRKIGAKDIEVLEQQGISVCQAVWPVVGGRALGTIIHYTPADSEIPEAVASRVSSEVEAMASASSSSAPRSASRPRARVSRPRAPRSRPSSDAGRVIHRLCGRENEGDIDPISLEPLKYTEYIVILECGHILSHSSYAQLRRTPTVGDKCPTCRHPIHD